MENIAVGVGLFALIILVGLIVGLRLSSSGPQRRAVVVSFVAMTLVAALFCVFAMYAALLWTVPIFAVACIVVPIAAYTLMMRGYRQAHPAVTYRASNEAPRPIHLDSHRNSAVDAAGMPIAPSHAANELLTLGAGAVGRAGAHADAAAKIPSEGAVNVQEEAAKTSQNSRGDSSENVRGSQTVDAFIEEYLVEENEDEDGLFEPELSPTLSPRATTVEETSAMMLTIPYDEGDEHYLVVSESTSVPNPILAYRRTTSSRLVPLGPGNHYAPPAPSGDGKISVPPGTPVWFPLRPPEEEESAPPVKATVGPEHAAPDTLAEEPMEELELFPEPSGPSPSLGFTEFINFVEVEPEPEPVTAIQPELFSIEPEPEPAAPASEPAKAVEAAPEPEPAPVPEALPPTAEVSAAPASAPVGRPAVSAFQVAGKRAEAAPAPAAEAPVAADVSASADAAATPSFEAFMAKAEGLRAKGLYPVAARLYAEAAQAASTNADAHRAQFDEIACYVKCGQGDKARALAGKLRASSVLTRVERIKLDAIERMG